MSPMKVMPLLLTAITPFVMMSGVARAAEPQIILVQSSPQQQEEERKKKEQQQHQQQQHPQQPQPPQHNAQHPQQPKAQEQKAQEQQHLQQQKQAQEQQQKAQDQEKALELKKQHELQLQHEAQEKALEQQKLKEHQAQTPAPQHQTQEQHPGQTPPGAHQPAPQADQAKIHQLQEQQRHTEQQLHQEEHKAAAQQQQAHRALSAEEQKARAARDANQGLRQKLIAQQRQTAANEHSQAAINERLRLQNERLRAISSQRHETVDAHGNKIITEPGNRTIVRGPNNQIFIRHDETASFKVYGGNVQTQRAANGNTISSIIQPGGGRIDIEVDIYGRPIRRVRIFPDGRRFVLFENRTIAAGIGLVALGTFFVALPPPHIDIPREEYIVDAGVASEDDIYGALYAPPVEPLDRIYSLDEVLASVSLRERMRSIDIDTINFEFGSWEIGPQQGAMLESVAAAIRDIVNQNPGEVFLIEGHTDAVGSDEDNLSLSDRRAQAVADALSQQFGVPRENLVTQGYGKQFLLIPTELPELRNRRVVVRRITPLLQGDQGRVSSGYGPQ